ncbi:MAG: hypothetical protein HYU81_01710 [Candidatus Brennerbacteria bacterium]|nr:hypothetical protein [Candidatus Brennerbacteria bacterium]
MYFHFLRLPHKRRALLAAAILAASIGVSAYFVASSAPNTPPAFSGSLTPIVAHADPAPEASNLTQEFTRQAVEKLITDNEPLKAEGAALEAYAVIPDAPDVAVIVSELIDRELTTEQLKTSDLLTHESNSKEIQLAYLFFINEILETQGGEMPALGAGSLATYFTDTAAKLHETAEILKAVKTPSSWLPLHRDLVAFFLRQGNIYRSLGAANTDPLRFMIAATRLLPAETEREFQKLQATIDQKIKDEKLI